MDRAALSFVATPNRTGSRADTRSVLTCKDGDRPTARSRGGTMLPATKFDPIQPAN